MAPHRTSRAAPRARRSAASSASKTMSAIPGSHGWSRPAARICATACAASAGKRATRSPSSSPWRSASAPTPPFSASSTPSCCSRCPMRAARISCSFASQEPGSRTPASRCSMSTTSRPRPPHSTPSSSITTCISSCSAATNPSASRPESCRGTTSTRSASRRARPNVPRQRRCGTTRRRRLVLSHEYWQRAFAGSRDVIGRVVEMNDRPHTIVGVLPDVPMYPQADDVYMPRSACPFRMNAVDRERRGGGMASASAGGVQQTLDQTACRSRRLSADSLQSAYPESYRADRGYALTANPLRREFTRHFESTLVILASTAGFVLLIVCASVANLAVARTMRRDRELVLRMALGASRGRLLRQLVTESVLLAMVGGACGLLLAYGRHGPSRAVRGQIHAAGHARSASTWRCCSSRSAFRC